MKPEVRDSFEESLSVTAYGETFDMDGAKLSLPDADASPLVISYTVLEFRKTVNICDLPNLTERKWYEIWKFPIIAF